MRHDKSPVLVVTPGPAAGVRGAIAGNLRRTRLARGHSVRELAELTGVSKALISQIERGVANPTIEVLTRLADALELTFTELTRTHLLEPEVIRRGEGSTEVVGDTTVRSLFAAADRRRFELAEGDLPPRTRSAKSAHGRGSIEHAYVVTGQVSVETEAWTVRLGEGDAVRFAAELDHVYVTGEAGCRVLTLISFSED
ncbi:XRE family transcriptional regulator [Nonomuraea gerenzanensis]|uniref:Transcriptional regulator, XRE family n=1 Tax=Nonomuraea gerenzanensis TaxID=93944 RepID=A0A1M4E3F0_9ACTN|nr:XRE family transcriptional regulator [Nonomuraea gerenzanensis]UBU15582.1 XRE family transcriptional regulator [Nonomuraea gerenzanensis]SBO93351.1 transcriptional regulator, XRE family [Nonomuraea gerenzanensis]